LFPLFSCFHFSLVSTFLLFPLFSCFHFSLVFTFLLFSVLCIYFIFYLLVLTL
jgi:hypothetical protein